MTNIEFAQKLKDVATKYKTLYVMGCFGAPMNAKNKERYKNNHSYNKQPARQAMIENATADTFGFDCVCLLKGILWNWSGDKSKVYGGATYKANGVPDIGADSIINQCSEISTNFDEIQVGELLWTKGHVGAYIGDGLCVECTPAWENKVQITAVNRNIAGYHRRNWTKHGKLPYVTYINKTEEKVEKENETVKEIVCPHCGNKINNDGSKIVEKSTTFKVGDKVKLTSDAVVYGKTTRYSSWVYSSTLYVRSIAGDRVVVSIYKEQDKPVTGPVHKNHIVKI